MPKERVIIQYSFDHLLISIIGVSSGYLRDYGGRFFGIKQTTVSMYRKSKTLQWRNREIYAEYCVHLRSGIPIMDIYAALGNRYDLSEDNIRRIVADQAKLH